MAYDLFSVGALNQSHGDDEDKDNDLALATMKMINNSV